MTARIFPSAKEVVKSQSQHEGASGIMGRNLLGWDVRLKVDAI